MRDSETATAAANDSAVNYSAPSALTLRRGLEVR